MNENHATLCSSPEWATHLQEEVLPFFLTNASLGDDVLEIGPGPGAATQWLAKRVRSLVAIEVSPEAAHLLAQQYVGTNVTVLTGDASQTDFADNSFDTVASFTMLHHVPTTPLQNAILSEAFRVLRPGGELIGSDSLASNELHLFHSCDTYNPIEPAALLVRLQSIGFLPITMVVDWNLKFVARKPDGTNESDDESK
ncbi:MAG TPA: class I SAM-dependent methyltransferase [Acidimicrobiales bacterium]